MTFLPLVFAYLGPETMLPMTSLLAGAAGVVMMFGRSTLRWCKGMFRRLSGASKATPPTRRIGSGPIGASKPRVRN